MSSSSPVRQVTRELSLRMRDPSQVNVHERVKASFPRDNCGPGRVTEYGEVALETASPVTSHTPPALEKTREVPLTGAPPSVRTSATHASRRSTQTRDEVTTVNTTDCETPQRASWCSQVASPSPGTREVTMLTTPYLKRCCAARHTSCRSDGAAENAESLTELVLSVTLNPSAADKPELDSVSAAAEQPAIPVVSVRYRCGGAAWCAVVAAHTGTVNRLCALDIASECYVAPSELSGLTLWTAEEAGLYIAFQLRASGDATDASTLQRCAEACTFPRLTALYQTFLSNQRTAQWFEASEEWRAATGNEDEHDGAPRCLEEDCDDVAAVTMDTTSDEAVARGVSEARRHLVAEFEVTSEDLRSIEIQKEQQILHLAEQLAEERRSAAQQITDLQNQLNTMLMNRAGLETELESVSAALLDAQESCMELRKTAAVNEERRRHELQEAEERYTHLETECARATAKLESRVETLQTDLFASQHAVVETEECRDVHDRQSASSGAAWEERLAASTRGAANMQQQHETLEESARALAVSFGREFDLKSDEALHDRQDLVKAGTALTDAEANLNAFSKRHLEAAMQHEQSTAQRGRELQTARTSLRAAEERCLHLETECARVVEVSAEKVAAARATVRAVEERCAELEAERALAAASLAEKSAVSESEVATARAAVSAAEQRCAQVEGELANAVDLLLQSAAVADAGLVAAQTEVKAARQLYKDTQAAHARRVAELEKRAYKAEREASSARKVEKATLTRTDRIVRALRNDCDARANELVNVTREIVLSRKALNAATAKCAVLEAERVAERNEAVEHEMAVAQEDLRRAKERYFAADAAAGGEAESSDNNPWEFLVEDLSQELQEVKEKLKTMHVLNQMLRDKFRSEMLRFIF